MLHDDYSVVEGGFMHENQSTFYRQTGARFCSHGRAVDLGRLCHVGLFLGMLMPRTGMRGTGHLTYQVPIMNLA